MAIYDDELPQYILFELGFCGQYNTKYERWEGDEGEFYFTFANHQTPMNIQVLFDSEENW